ncbi:DNA-directed RNA polymerase [Actinidia chinensis var. chinensis]|uniref:DNA-directed RNA polymerase n=1 Tax=Actinidia chinensis var. chinensis TaxID=1590841 RepID=A0A2R6PKC6_ACTCC|nr:DNA-directed RNA polymerase [Actinidia chinensis var. chinensis]
MAIIVVIRKRDRGFSSLLLLNFFFFAIFSGRFISVSALNYTKYRQVGSLRLARIQRHLDKINKPPVLTIQSPDGDIIDCVHKRKQPALDHPLLKNHKIQKSPPERPKMMRMMKEENDGVRRENRSSPSEGIAWQMWHQKGQKCPMGTVPVRRSTVHDVLRSKSLFDFGKKQRNSLPLSRRVDAPDVVSGNGHEHAIAYTGASEEVYGARATINVWDPAIEEVNEFSLSQIWVLSGSFDGSDLNSIEAGWQVSPELYGDSRPRLFTYWTSDSYQATGCYNLLCSGFVQTNSRIAIGAAISPVSFTNGNQYDITILIWKDPKLGNWWMGFGDSMLVGYWPAELFTHLADRATMVEWGGEVVNSRANGRHTTTQMGSGHFAEDGFGKASYFRNLEIVDSDNSLSSARDISTLAENTNCYNIKSSYNNEWGTHFYYGGPGNNPECP